MLQQWGLSHTRQPKTSQVVNLLTTAVLLHITVSRNSMVKGAATLQQYDKYAGQCMQNHDEQCRHSMKLMIIHGNLTGKHYADQILHPASEMSSPLHIIREDTLTNQKNRDAHCLSL